MSEPTQQQPPILEFRETVIAREPARGGRLEGINLRLAAGELAMIRVDRMGGCPPLAAAAGGLVPVVNGSVWFQEVCWSRCGPAQSARMRGQIGRTFDRSGWVSNLSIVENVVLRLRHHTRRSTKEILSEAEQLAHQFGLPEVPKGRSSFVPAADLRRAQWVRAFLGEPSLLLLERPMLGVAATGLEPFIAAVKAARRRGAAVMWITSDERVWESDAVEARWRHVVEGHKLRPVTEAHK